MKIGDLIIISISNLVRRKVRTALTILGVLIGTASVVTMLSIGFGVQKMTEDSIKREGSLTQIEVTPREMYSNESSKKVEPKYLDDKMVATFKNLNHVKSVSPSLSVSATIKQGKWELFAQIMGVDEEYLKDVKLASGEIPKSTDKEMKLLFGNGVIMQFYDSKSLGFSHNEPTNIPDVDYNKTLFTIFKPAYTESTSQSTSTSTSTSGESTKQQPERKYVFPTAGVIAGDPTEYNRFYSRVYVNIDILKSELKRIYGKRPIPEQPTTKRGKPLKFLVYSEVFVNVDKLENVETVRKAIEELGFEAISQTDWIESAKKQTQTLQGMLGGIGVVSLVVAAIGIANTMMMSIYERTKEIGIIKVLGCDMRKIRDMFLIESGLIGLIGGITGILFSYLLSFIANNMPTLREFFYADSNISVIPNWMPWISIIFATFVGMVSGFMPSLRAMRLSPLAALRNE